MNPQQLYVSSSPSLTALSYMCIYIVSVYDYVSNVNFSVVAPLGRSPDKETDSLQKAENEPGELEVWLGLV